MTGSRVPSTAHVTAGAVALDPSAIARLRRFGGDSLVTQMVALFVSTGRERLDAARTAAASGDCAGAQRAFHALKSSAGQLGATGLQALCERGETLAMQGNATCLPEVVGSAYEQFLIAVRLLQAGPPA